MPSIVLVEKKIKKVQFCAVMEYINTCYQKQAFFGIGPGRPCKSTRLSVNKRKVIKYDEWIVAQKGVFDEMLYASCDILCDFSEKEGNKSHLSRFYMRGGELHNMKKTLKNLLILWLYVALCF